MPKVNSKNFHQKFGTLVRRLTPLRPPAKGWGSGQKSGQAIVSACPESTHEHHKPTKTARVSSPQKHTVGRCFTEAYAVSWRLRKPWRVVARWWRVDCDPDDQHMAVPGGENVVAADVAEPRCSHAWILSGCLSVLLTTGMWLVVAEIEFCCQERSVTTCDHFGVKVSANQCNW